jgi:hypothetical protein
MKSQFLSSAGRAAKVRAFGATFGIFALAVVLAFPSKASTESWEDKDWTQWTAEDCNLILTSSPWVATNSTNGPTTYEKGERTKSIAQIASSMVIRHAAVRQAQLEQDRDHMAPKAKQEFDQQAAACLNQDVTDRIVIGLDAYAQSDDSRAAGDLVIGKQKYPISQTADWIASNPCPFYAVVITIPRTVDGKPIIGPADKKMEIKSPSIRSFSFDPQKLIYKGKPDF